MSFDQRYLLFALAYVTVGMCLGIYMGLSQNHGQLVAHAHILLVGFVVSFVYGIVHKLWLDRPNRVIANAQFVLHQAASIAMFCALLLLYGGVVPEAIMGPLLGAASVGVLVGALLMIYMVFRFGTEARQTT